MKKIFIIIFLSLCFTTTSYTDDISDFQIEEMSLGDNLLDYFSPKEISQNKSKTFKNKLFDVSTFELALKKYDYVQVIYSKTFVINGLEGIKQFRQGSSSITDQKKRSQKCLSKQKEIIAELDTILLRFKKRDLNTVNNQTFIRYMSKKKDSIIITCNDEKDYMELRVLLRTKAFDQSFNN